MMDEDADAESFDSCVEEDNNPPLPPPPSAKRPRGRPTTTRKKRSSTTTVSRVQAQEARQARDMRVLEDENFKLRQALRQHASGRSSLESDIRDEVSLEMVETIDRMNDRFQKELEM